MSPPPVKPHSLPEVKRSLRVLLAEDNSLNQVFAVRVLEKRGYSVSVVGNGRDALSAFEKESFDLILMDVQMPEMDGLEATVAIREKEKSTGGHIPIIAMTAHSLVGDDEVCLAAGMDGYVSKPIRTTQLFSVMEGFFASKDQTHLIAALEQAQKTNIDEMQQIQDQHTTKP